MSTSKERNKWNRDFAARWRWLQHRGKLPLSSGLAVAAREFRDAGQSPVSTADGLYMGTRDAQRAEQLRRADHA